MYDAEELMIDVFTRLVRSKEPLQGKASLKTYLFVIGKNLALRHLLVLRPVLHFGLGLRLCGSL